jgi:starch phosphorylase
LDIKKARNLCVFTTHTPIEAGHDKFSYDLVREVLGGPVPLDVLKKLSGQERLNITLFALNLSNYHNGVAKETPRLIKSDVPRI